jgi:predicted  nucleic acid-binding Zn-ribbon protein
VNNPKELYTLQQEVQRLRAQQSRQEEMALEVMDTADNLRELVERKEAALREAEAAWQQESADLITHRDTLVTRQQELQVKRDTLAGSIDAALLKRYEAMRRAKQGQAISRVEQNSCQWCRVILTASELQRVRTSDELQVCSNCGRILYYDR